MLACSNNHLATCQLSSFELHQLCQRQLHPRYDAFVINFFERIQFQSLVHEAVLYV
jgi:hypothetical protein